MKLIGNILFIAIAGVMFCFATIVEASDGYEAWREKVLNEIDARVEDPTGPPTAFDHAYGQLSKDGGRALAAQRIIESEAYISQHSNDPVLFYIRGWLGRELQVFYMLDLQENNRPYFVDAPENQAMIKSYQSYYTKALNLDDNPDAPMHLDHYMLVNMDDVLAPADLSERILKKSLKLSQQGNESYDGQEWTTYEFLLGTYVEAKDYDNYLKTVNEMMERFPNNSRMAELENYKQQAEALIEKRDHNAMQRE